MNVNVRYQNERDETHLVTHIFNGDPWNRVEFVIATSNEDPVDSLVLSVDVELSKNDDVFGVASAVCDLKEGRKVYCNFLTLSDHITCCYRSF